MPSWRIESVTTNEPSGESTRLQSQRTLNIPLSQSPLTSQQSLDDFTAFRNLISSFSVFWETHGMTLQGLSHCSEQHRAWNEWERQKSTQRSRKKEKKAELGPSTFQCVSALVTFGV